jgi:hypothetical protein
MAFIYLPWIPRKKWNFKKKSISSSSLRPHTTKNTQEEDVQTSKFEEYYCYHLPAFEVFEAFGTTFS